jgi:hypothetical protein
LLGGLVEGLLGDLLGISTTVGLGAGVGDPYSVAGTAAGPGARSFTRPAPSQPVGAEVRLGLGGDDLSRGRDGAALLTLPPAPGVSVGHANGNIGSFFATETSAGSRWSQPLILLAGLTQTTQSAGSSALGPLSDNPFTPLVWEWSAESNADHVTAQTQPAATPSNSVGFGAEVQPDIGPSGWPGGSDAVNAPVGPQTATDGAGTVRQLPGPGSDREVAALFALALAGSAFRFADEEELRQRCRSKKEHC